MDRIPSHWVFLRKVLVPAGGVRGAAPFHVKRGQVTALDQEGIELADAAHADEEAVRRGDGGISRPRRKPFVTGISSDQLSLGYGLRYDLARTPGLSRNGWPLSALAPLPWSLAAVLRLPTALE